MQKPDKTSIKRLSKWMKEQKNALSASPETIKIKLNTRHLIQKQDIFYSKKIIITNKCHTFAVSYIRNTQKQQNYD